jgi:hypothetical protein
LNGAWSQQDPLFPFNQYLPNRIVRTAGANGTYQIRDGTNVTRGADGTLNPIDPATGLPTRGNIAETFEFRAVDRDLRTPYIQQYNFGIQRELWANTMIEVRYVGSRGADLLESIAFNQGYEINAADTPDYILERFNNAYVAAGSPNGPLNAGTTARARGLGRAFGFPNPSLDGMIDYNLANASGSVIGFEARTPVLGFNVPEAVILGNTGRSIYNSIQFSPIRAVRLVGASLTCRMPVSSCRAISATPMRTTPCQTSTDPTGSAAASSGSYQDRARWAVSACPASSNCSLACRTRSSPPSLR